MKSLILNIASNLIAWELCFFLQWIVMVLQQTRLERPFEMSSIKPMRKEPASAMTGVRRKRWKQSRRWLTYFLLLLPISALAGITCLVVTLPPAKSALLHYEGFYSLPSHGLLNVLDYLTVSGKHLYVAGESSGSLFQLSLPDGGTKMRELRGYPEVHGLAVVPELQVLFAARSGKENQVDVVDLQDMSLLSTIRVAAGPDSILYDDRTKLIYVANSDSKLGTIIDPFSRCVRGTVSLSGSPEAAAVDQESGIIFQNLKDRNALAGVDVVKQIVVGEWPLNGCETPSGIAIDPVARQVFSVSHGNGRLVIFNINTHHVITSLAIAKEPDAKFLRE